jgi:hypothetical protein
MSHFRNPSADWTSVLARVEQALNQAVAKIHEREQALAEAAAVWPGPPNAPNFANLEERSIALLECPRRAEQTLVQVDAALRDSEEALREWLTRAEATRRHLATWVGRAVG